MGRCQRGTEGPYKPGVEVSQHLPPLCCDEVIQLLLPLRSSQYTRASQLPTHTPASQLPYTSSPRLSIHTIFATSNTHRLRNFQYTPSSQLPIHTVFATPLSFRFFQCSRSEEAASEVQEDGLLNISRGPVLPFSPFSFPLFSARRSTTPLEALIF